MTKVRSSSNLFDNLTNLKYISLYDIITTQVFLNEVNKTLNNIDNLTVCQNSDIITNPNPLKMCCNNDVVIDYCEDTSNINYIMVYYGQNESKYNSDFINKYRNNITSSVSEKAIIGIDGDFIIEPGSKIKIYFSSPLTTLESFFDKRYDERTGNIISIDFSHFDSSLLTSIDYIFYGCDSLESVNVTNLNTTLLKSMNSSFYDCKSLVYLDLSNLDTSNLNNMDYLFYGCNSLKSIDLSNWNLNNVEFITNIFYNLENLEYFNLNNIQMSSELIEKINDYNFSNRLIVCQSSNIITNTNIRKICCDYNF